MAIATGCHSPKPLVIDSALASCVPAGTIALAGINIDQLRSTRFAPSLAAFEMFHDASYLLLVSDGKGVLLIARGKFRTAPPGATLISSDIAVSGPPESLRSAIAQYKSGSTGAPRLLDWAAEVAGGKSIWAVAQGDVTLPLSGNAANLNRILHFTEHVTLAAQVDSHLQVDITGVCRTADAGQKLEESVRALITFASLGTEREPDLTRILKSIEIRRDGLTVHATISATSESASKLLGNLMR